METRELLAENAVELKNITVSFPNVLANDDVSLDIRKNEVFAIIGENGAGKTTLMNVLYGLIRPRGGEVIINGRKITDFSPKSSIERGLGMVHQHFMLVPSFTVAQNISLGREPRRFGFIYDNKAAVSLAQRISEEYELAIDPSARVRDISIGMQQRVEILKALSRGSEILIFDEPTAVLTPGETRELLSTMRVMSREKGKTIIIITHKLREVMEVSDRVAVMRSGRLIGVENTSDVDERRLASMMVGRDVLFGALDRPQAAACPSPVIQTKDLRAADDRGLLSLNGVSLAVNAGEIVGIAGVEGNGQTELAEAITGLRKPLSGDIYINGTRVNGMRPGDIRGLKLAHVPEDRLKMALAGSATVAENIIAGRHKEKRFTRLRLFTRKAAAEAYAKQVYGEFGIKGAGVSDSALSLSGGNMQKTVIGREFSFENVNALVIAQPTRGVDIGATEFIHSRIIEKRNAGCGVLLISADLDELIRLSDRILTLYKGRVTGEFNARTALREDIGAAMLGGVGEEDK